MIAVMSSIAISAFALEDSTIMPKLGKWGFGRGHGWGRNGHLEISTEYEENVITIAESDADVQGYLADGYSFKGVRPVIKSIVDVEGDVITKATNAVYLLENKDAKEHVAAWVDLDTESVTKIVILTKTVIEKS